MKSKTNLLRNSMIFAGFTLFSRILGFVRDMITAMILGPSADVFIFAQRIPNLFRRLFAEGSFSQAFIPVLAKYHAEGDEQKMRSLLASATGWLSLITLTITALGVLGSSYITFLLANGWSNNEERLYIASLLLKITFPYLFCVSLVALCGAVFNVLGSVALFSFTPALLNASIIIAGLLLPALGVDPLISLSLGVLCGGIIQLLIQLPFLYRIGFLVKPSLKITPGLKRMVKNIIPAIIAASSSQINMLVNTFVASFFILGTLSWLYYAERLLELPLGIFGVAISTVLLPTLSRKVNILQKDPSAENRASFRKAMDWGVNTIFIVSIPASVFLFTLAPQVITFLFFHGKFVARDVEMTSLALMAYSFSVLPSMLTKTLTNGFFAHENMKTPMYISMLTIGINILLNFAALYYFRNHNSLPELFVLLAVSTSIATSINATLIYLILHYKNYYKFSITVIKHFAKVFLASVALYGYLTFMVISKEDFINLTIFKQFLYLSFYGVSGLAIYALVLFASGLRLRSLRYVENTTASPPSSTTTSSSLLKDKQDNKVHYSNTEDNSVMNSSSSDTKGLEEEIKELTQDNSEGFTNIVDTMELGSSILGTTIPPESQIQELKDNYNQAQEIESEDSTKKHK